MIEADRDKLVKILRMFGSAHDGEVAAAARLAHKLVKDRALDWDDLIVPVHRSSKKQWHNTEEEEIDEADLIHRCAELYLALTPWEKEFISSISDSIVEWGKLTAKQRVILDRIVNKLKVKGLWEQI